MKKIMKVIMGLIVITLAAIDPATAESAKNTRYSTIKIQDTKIFYREAGNKNSPAIVLLHGFPTSSHMYRNLMSDLAGDFYVIAPDYPGFGNSEQPKINEFDYSFDNFASIVETLLGELKVKKYALYLMDYGAPVGFRIASKNPNQITGLIIQNGNAYNEGLRDFWIPIKKYWRDRSNENAVPLAEFITPEGVKWQYTHGVRNESSISPDNWNADLAHLTRKGNPEIQLALFYDYQNNVPLYPKWQQYFRQHQPPTLIVWGENDYIFPADGAHPYKRDLKNLDFNLLNTGHFALEEDGEVIASLIQDFMKRNEAAHGA